MATTLVKAFKVIFAFFVGVFQFLTMDVVEVSKVAIGFIIGASDDPLSNLAIEYLSRVLTYVFTWGGLAGDDPTILTFLFGAGIAGVAIYVGVTVCKWILDLFDKLPFI